MHKLAFGQAGMGERGGGGGGQFLRKEDNIRYVRGDKICGDKICSDTGTA